MRMIEVQAPDEAITETLINPMHVVSVTATEGHSGCVFNLTEERAVLSSWSIDNALLVLNQAME